MKKQDRLFNLSVLTIIVIFLIRQIYYLTKISNLIISNSIQTGLGLITLLLVSIPVIVLLIYYLPLICIYKLTIIVNIKRLFNINTRDNEDCIYTQLYNSSNIYKQLNCYRCWFLM